MTTTPLHPNYRKQCLEYARSEMARYAHFKGWKVEFSIAKTCVYQVDYTNKVMRLSKYLVRGISNVHLVEHYRRNTEIRCDSDWDKLQFIVENMLVLGLSCDCQGHDQDELDNMAGMIGTVRVKVVGDFIPKRVRYCNKPGCTAKITGYRFPNPHHRVHKDCGGRFLLARPAPVGVTTVTTTTV